MFLDTYVGCLQYFNEMELRLIYARPETPDSCAVRTVQQKLSLNLDVFRCF